MSNNNGIKRAKIQLKTPNPLFEKWLVEWHEEVSQSENICEETIFSKALGSLRKFPIKLNSGRECIILEHFDPDLCNRLHQKLVDYEGDFAEGGLSSQNTQDIKLNFEDGGEYKSILSDKPTQIKNEPEARKKTKSKNIQSDSSNEKKEVPKKKGRPYVPQHRSAAYGLLVGLLKKEDTEDFVGYVTKAELQIEGQKYCDVPLKREQRGSFYNGWSSMSQLISKGLVHKYSNPAKFQLTEEGRILATKLIHDNSSSPSHKQSEKVDIKLSKKTSVKSPLVAVLTQNSCGQPSPKKTNKKRIKNNVESEQSESSQSQDVETEEFVFLKNSFEIILLVDNKETSGPSKKDDETILQLESTGVRFETRHLKVGDYLWVARDSQSRELVLPYIVERKRMDDLASSIKDGRFHEQKFRLKQCGLQQVIYLIENYGANKSGLPIANLLQGVANTMVSEKFTLRVTENAGNSIIYLTSLTFLFSSIFLSKTLFSCKKDVIPSLDTSDDIISLMSFKEFSYGIGKSKNFTVKDMFTRQLVQLHGLSGEKAWAISSKFESPTDLIRYFKNGGGEETLADLKFGAVERRLGQSLASVLRVLFGSSTFPQVQWITDNPN